MFGSNSTVGYGHLAGWIFKQRNSRRRRRRRPTTATVGYYLLKLVWYSSSINFLITYEANRGSRAPIRYLPGCPFPAKFI